MNKISLKIGLLFFCIILSMETFLFFFLHKSIVQTRIDEELATLATRGNNHRDVLEKFYSQETMKHIVLMEYQSDTEVIITDKNNETIMASKPFHNEINNILPKEAETLQRKGMVLEDRWNSQPYIVTVCPFQTEEQEGYVYMLKNTDQVQALIARLNKHFLIAGIASVIVMGLTILILSKIIAKPLIKMKEATKEMSEGNFTIQLSNKSNDELGELASSIQSLATELNHMKRERNEFLASISHELGTPLTFIKGYADVARRTELPPSERREYLSIIVEEAEKLAKLIKELFELAKLDNNHFTIHKKSVPLCTALQSIYDRAAPAFQHKGQKLTIHCSENIYIQTDPVRFEQIIFNLLENAKKYSHKGSVTTITVSPLKHGKVKLLITDSGTGIPKEDIPFIFSRLYRVDKSRTRASGGSGLGLAIVKKLVDAHGWKIDVQSEVNKGTTFNIIMKGEKK